MEQLELNRQLQVLGSLEGGLFRDATEYFQGMHIFKSAFYGITNALLNITEGQDGAVVDISMQPNIFEALKSRMGLGALSTIDWLGQVARNLYEVDKPVLLAKGGTGIMMGMGIPLLHVIDMLYENPAHALVIEDPQQEGSFPCVEAREAAQSLCATGLEGAMINTCPVDSQSYQVHVNQAGGVIINWLTPPGAVQKTVTMTCDVLPVGTAPQILEQQTSQPVQPAVPTSPETSQVPDVTCVENPLIGTFNPEAVIAGFQAACGITISPEMAQEFLNATGTEGRQELYGLATAEQLAGWAEQQWPVYMGDVTTSELTTAPTATTAPVEVSPLTPSKVCNLTDPGIEDRITLNTGSPEEFREELLTKCGLDLTPEQLDFFAQALELDIWVNGTVAEVRLQFLKEMSLALGVGQKGPEVQVTPDGVCGEPVRIEIPMDLSSDEGLAFFRNEVLLQCGVEITDLEAEAIMQSRNESMPDNVHVVSTKYLLEIKNQKIDIEDYSPDERYSALGRFAAMITLASVMGTFIYMFWKRIGLSEVFGTTEE